MTTYKSKIADDGDEDEWSTIRNLKDLPIG